MVGDFVSRTGGPRASWRLTFRFDGRSVDLVRTERLDMVAPGATGEPPKGGEQTGAWVELLDTHGEVLDHRRVYDPFRTRAEHHSPDGRIEVHFRAPEPTEFEVVLAALPQADAVRLWASRPNEQGAIAGAAEDWGTFTLEERDDGRE